MDSLITAAARALAVGDPLGALQRVALRDDAPALALRGTAMAQLGDFVRARALLRRAARAFGSREALSRARCLLAEAEIALAVRDLGALQTSLGSLRQTLETHGDRANAAHARYLIIRRSLLIGRLDDAERELGRQVPDELPAPLRVMHELIVAGIAIRRIETNPARLALVRAARAAARARIPALMEEVKSAMRALTAPAARLVGTGTERMLRLGEVEAVLASGALVVDACRFRVSQARRTIELSRRPVLFTLARLMAEAWPGDVARETLIRGAFRARHVDETYRARLRVEVGRLRRLLRSVADVVATRQGFALVLRQARTVAVLAQPGHDEHAAVIALLADGQSWSSSALALALGASPRTVQRALGSLAAAGKVRSLGRGRARRWVAPLEPEITSALLLPAALPGG